MTVFVRSDTLIAVQGTGIEEADDVWDRVLDWMETLAQRSQEVTNSGDLGVQGKLKASTGIFGLAKAETEGGGDYRKSLSGDICYLQEEGLSQIVEEISDSDFVILIDDFHYMSRDIQIEVAKALKEGGLKICTACVIHRGDDVVRANPELRGRVRSIDIDYWKPDDLRAKYRS